MKKVFFLPAMALTMSCALQTRLPSSVPPESVKEAPLMELNKEEGIPSMRSSPFGDYGVSIDEKNRVVAFSFDNDGVNRIIPKPYQIGMGPQRSFTFHFDSRARQDIYLDVTDAPSDKLSELMSSYFYFFPRKILPAISVVNGDFVVSLPSLEEIVFDGKSKEIKSGVLKEGLPIDLGPDRFKRKFPDISYSGTGIMLRADRRGEDPRIVHASAPNAKVIKVSGGTCTKELPCECLIPKNKIWEQSGSIHFLFKSDEEFDKFLKIQCKFGFL